MNQCDRHKQVHGTGITCDNPVTEIHYNIAAMQRKTAVTAHLKSKQLLLFAFVYIPSIINIIIHFIF